MLFIFILLCICCLVPLADSLSMSPEFAALRGVNVVSALDGNAREMSQLELARQIQAEIVPELERLQLNRRPKLICVGIGTHKKAKAFVELTKLDAEYLYSDAANAVYDALDLLKSNPISLLTDVRTPIAMAKRIKEGKTGYLKQALQEWQPWIPPKLEQGLQQGGAFVFEGETLLFGRKDPATGDHVKLEELLRVVLPGDKDNELPPRSLKK